MCRSLHLLLIGRQICVIAAILFAVCVRGSESERNVKVYIATTATREGTKRVSGQSF